MEKDVINSLQGQVRALATTLTAIIGGLPPAWAAEAATKLQVALDVDREEEELTQNSPPRTIASRDAIADAFLELLRARSQT